MATNLEDLLKSLNEYKGVTSDSRLVQDGFIFVALRGKSTDGHEFIPEAIKKGAAAIVGEANLADTIKNYIKVPDSWDALGTIASEFYGRPSEKLKIIGVTGTKGKTTTVHLIHHILTKLGKKAGILSSISVPGLHVTSPDVVFLHKSLNEFVDKGYEYAVIEVSSHGIDQKRIAGVKFDLAVLTNIAPEHLDYHKTLEEYKKVKMSFINSARDSVIAPKETDIDILPGKFNNLNAEAAILAVAKFGIKRSDALETAKSFKLPFGRLTEVPNDLGIRIFIDFAHTPDSLEAVLTYLKSETKGKLISVFGCAGERDPGKRFKMGKISVNLADFSVFTAEDPRSENLSDILSEMAKGAESAGGVEEKSFTRVYERGEAIVYAINRAQKGDMVGIFGKGHEESMAFGGFEHPWSDLTVVNNYLNRDTSTSAVILAAGRGTRMKSELPKVLHEICGRPMISYSLQNLRNARIGEIVAVVSYRKDLVVREIGGAIRIAIQKDSKGGTADATYTGARLVSEGAHTVVVMYGDDTAFYSPQTINRVIERHREAKAILTFVTLFKQDPHGLGRIVRDTNGELMTIVEEKDATESERKIKEINDGMYVFEKEWLLKNLPNVKNNPITGELYINEVIKMAIDQKVKISIYQLPDAEEWQGVNTPEELEKAKARMEEKLKNING